LTGRRVVITADDFGMAPGVDAGIIEAAAAGSVSAVSVLVNLRDPRETSLALERLRKAAPMVGIGLHFNCTMGCPLTAAHSIRDQRTGQFYSLPALATRVLAGRVGSEDVARECEAQLAALQRIVGVVSHIDGHLHAHALPVIWGAVTGVARRNGVPHVRQPIEPWGMNPLDLRASLKKLVLRASFVVAARGGDASELQSPGFAGMSLRGNSSFAPRLLALLDELPPGTTELMVHPGHADPAALRYTGYVAGREAELAALTSSAVRERLSRDDITLTHFGA
jgi:chitin disaccharide deacetylase